MVGMEQLLGKTHTKNVFQSSCFKKLENHCPCTDVEIPKVVNNVASGFPSNLEQDRVKI